MNRVDRLMGYLLLFQSRGLLRARDFAARFEISERTVYRDIQALCEVGVPIVALPGEGYRLLDGYYLPPIVFSEAEARALFLAISMLTGLAEPGATRQAAEHALEKLRVVVPREMLAQVEALHAVLGFYTVGRPPLQLDDDRFVRLQQAIQRRQVVHLRYHALHDNSVTERDVEPLELAYLDNAWILGAYCRLRQDQRNFRLDRIDDLAVKLETFAPRALVRRRLPAAGTRVVVRFDPAVLRWVREAQHYAFVAEHADDRGGTLMVYQVASAEHLISWLLTWGSRMEVLAPETVRTAIADTAARMAARHRDGTPSARYGDDRQ